MRAFVLYVSEEVILSFKVIRLAEVAVNTCTKILIREEGNTHMEAKTTAC